MVKPKAMHVVMATERVSMSSSCAHQEQKNSNGKRERNGSDWINFHATLQCLLNIWIRGDISSGSMCANIHRICLLRTAQYKHVSAFRRRNSPKRNGSCRNSCEAKRIHALDQKQRKWNVVQIISKQMNFVYKLNDFLAKKYVCINNRAYREGKKLRSRAPAHFISFFVLLDLSADTCARDRTRVCTLYRVCRVPI